MIEKDFIIVGSGIAGLSAAFFASQKGSVVLITKGFDLRDSKSFHRNDGVLFSKNLDLLKKDISEASEGYFDEEKIDFFIENVNGVYYFLRDILGVNFLSKGEKIFGYSEEVVYFTGERTGEDIAKKIIERIENNANIEIFLETDVKELIYEDIKEREARKEYIGGKRVKGVIGYKNGEKKVFIGKNILLATGSGRGIHNFDYLSDGIKLAKSVGAKIGKMNHISWNPLCLDDKKLDYYFLPLEILNYGAFLVNSKGEKFLQRYILDEKYLMKDLSDAFFLEEKKTGKIFLDMRYRAKNFWKEKFPQLYYFLEYQGYDISNDLLPLKNIQQFLIGGVEVFQNAKTSVQGLYVSGELASFGVLGANWLPGIIIPKSIILSKSFVDNAVI